MKRADVELNKYPEGQEPPPEPNPGGSDTDDETHG